MASYLLKKQSDHFYHITLSRKLIGTVTLINGKWTAQLSNHGIRAKVEEFHTADTAFYAAALAIKCQLLAKNGGETVPFITRGKETANAETEAYNSSLSQYVSAFNRHNADSGRQMRVVRRRR